VPAYVYIVQRMPALFSCTHRNTAISVQLAEADMLNIEQPEQGTTI